MLVNAGAVQFVTQSKYLLIRLAVVFWFWEFCPLFWKVWKCDQLTIGKEASKFGNDMWDKEWCLCAKRMNVQVGLATWLYYLGVVSQQNVGQGHSVFCQFPACFMYVLLFRVLENLQDRFNTFPSIHNTLWLLYFIIVFLSTERVRLINNGDVIRLWGSY